MLAVNLVSSGSVGDCLKGIQEVTEPNIATLLRLPITPGYTQRDIIVLAQLDHGQVNTAGTWLQGRRVIPDKKKMRNSTGTSHLMLRNTTETLRVLGLILAPVNSNKTKLKITS